MRTSFSNNLFRWVVGTTTAPFIVVVVVLFASMAFTEAWPIPATLSGILLISLAGAAYTTKK